MVSENQAEYKKLLTYIANLNKETKLKNYGLAVSVQKGVEPRVNFKPRGKEVRLAKQNFPEAGFSHGLLNILSYSPAFSVVVSDEKFLELLDGTLSTLQINEISNLIANLNVKLNDMNIVLGYGYSEYSVSSLYQESGFKILYSLASLLGTDYFNPAAGKSLKNKALIFHPNEYKGAVCDGNSIKISIATTNAEEIDAAIRSCLK